MHILLEILYAIIESIIFDALAYIPRKIYRALITLIYGAKFIQEPKRIHWLPRYILGGSSVLFTVGLITACVMTAYRAIIAIQS